VSAFIEERRAAGFAVELVCRTIGVSRSAHYQRQSGQRSARAVRDEELLATIRRLHEANSAPTGTARCTWRCDGPGWLISGAIASDGS
jgi:hypothetical protein